MNKEEMVHAFAQKTGATKKGAELALDAVFQIISDALTSGDRVQIVGFGTFEVKQRAPRTGRNPKANLPVHIPARRVPCFTPGKTLKFLVERGGKSV